MKKDNTKISIIFPLYNGKRFLTRNFNSITKLTNLDEIELIIIDNNSSDSSIEIIQSYKKKIDIKLINKNKNLGFAKASNIGATYAKGNYLFITNQDVIFEPNFFLKLEKIYTMYKNEEIVLSPALIFEDDGIHYFGAKIHFLGFSYTPEVMEKNPTNKIIKETQRLSGGSLFIKKKTFLDIGGFDPIFFMYYEDTDLSLRFMRNGIRIITTNDPYLIHQKHDWKFSNFQYFLLERNRYISIFKNIDNIKKLFPYFIISEFILIFHSIISKFFRFKIRIYYELLTHRKVIKKIRNESRKKAKFLSYQKLSKELDPILLGVFQDNILFRKFLKMFNSLLRQI